jgi:capsular polysaccharide biosynthesis protein
VITEYQSIHFHRGLCYFKGEPVHTPLGANPYSLINEYRCAVKEGIHTLDRAYLLPLYQTPTKSGNFFHFHYHEMQRICGYTSKGPGGQKLAVADSLTAFQESTLRAIVSEDHILYLNPHRVYCVKEATVGNYIDTECIPLQLVDMYSALSEHPQISSHTRPAYTCAYVSRRIRPGNAGNSRIFTNETEVISKLSDIGIPTLYFEDMDVWSKIRLLNSEHLTIITTIGSQLTNLLFRNQRESPANMLVIDHQDWALSKSRMLNLLENANVNYTTFKSLKAGHVDYDPRNSPFRVDSDALLRAMRVGGLFLNP